MKFGKSILSIGLASALLMGCGANNSNDRFADNYDGTRNVGYAPTENSYQNDENFNQNFGRNVGTNRFNNRGGDDGQGTAIGNNGTSNQGNNMDIADEIADKVTDLTEVERAYVLTTDHNAYVAVKLEESQNNRLVGNIETRITEIVKKTDPDLDQVYISENPDFFEHVNNYRDDVRNGRPVRGFVDEFSNMVERIFPNRQ